MEWAYWLIGFIVIFVLVGLGLVIYSIWHDKQVIETAHLQAKLDQDTDNNANWGQMNRDAEQRVDEVVDKATRHYLDIK
jgi:hypothetical protein